MDPKKISEGKVEKVAVSATYGNVAACIVTNIKLKEACDWNDIIFNLSESTSGEDADIFGGGDAVGAFLRGEVRKDEGRRAKKRDLSA